MNFKASTRSGLIIAASLLVCATGLARAAEGDAAPETAANVGTATDTSAEAPVAKRHRRHAVRKTVAKSHKAASAKASKSDDEGATADAKAKSGPSMPPAVANANAQWPAQATPDTTSSMAAQADSVLQQVAPQPEQPASAAPADLQTSGQVVASDQLNDLDRAATEQTAAPSAPPQAPITLAKATADVPAAAQESVSQDNSTWDRTSMIGKVFIAFGGVLTMASAVRMFMA